jgi:hypothetical protein
MKPKTTTITVERIRDGKTQELTVEHAENLLRMRNGGGWRLPEKSKFELTKDGIRYKRDKGTDNEATA